MPCGHCFFGFPAGVGFIHTGKQLSFVYDVADLYKADIAIPAAFSAVKQSADPSGKELKSLVRLNMRRELSKRKLLRKIPEDLEWIFQVAIPEDESGEQVGELWDEDGALPGGMNWGKE